jgi:hypothetical protein
MDHASDILFDDTVCFSNFIEIDATEEDLDSKSLYPYNEQPSYDDFTHHMISSLDPGVLNISNPIGQYPPLDQLCQAPLQCPELVKDLNDTPPFHQRALSSCSSLRTRDSKDSSKSPSVEHGSVIATQERGTTLGASENSPRPQQESNPLAKKKRGRKKKSLTPAQKSAARKKFLERNRVAASKCREKKREKTDRLLQWRTTLEAENRSLIAQADEARDEVNILKSLIMMHSSCSDPALLEWVRKEEICSTRSSIPGSSLSLNSLEAGPNQEQICGRKALFEVALVRSGPNSSATSSGRNSPRASIQLLTKGLQLEPATQSLKRRSSADSGIEVGSPVVAEGTGTNQEVDACYVYKVDDLV